ncbi:MAG: hypothetical protein K2G69_05855, partial [Muribaculaceae bacterium]|nr:hypothetical protein [Muribaculaceae bacterium]
LPQIFQYGNRPDEYDRAVSVLEYLWEQPIGLLPQSDKIKYNDNKAAIGINHFIFIECGVILKMNS